MFGDLSLSDAEKVVVKDLANGARYWTETYGRILDKAGSIITPDLNPMQDDVLDVVAWCLENNKPIRIIILKPRQKGCSTISTALMYWLMCRFVINAVLIGGQYDQVDNLWKIFRRYAESDQFDWGFARPVMERSASFENGSCLARETAGDEEAGRSGTFQFMLATEAARWKKTNAADVLAGIMNCIPYLANTCVILESTARGPAGFFYDYWQAAATFDEFKNGKEGNGFIKVFSPWFDHDDSLDQIDDPIEEGRLVDTFTPDERAMVTQYALKPGHIQYYRRTIEMECKRDPAVMQREYPSTPEEAFHASSNQRFNSVGLKLMRIKAEKDRWEYGVLDGEDPRYTWTATDENGARLMMLERPIEGCRYSIPVDVMTGGSQVEGDDPDLHAGLVIRSAYHDNFGRFCPPKVVARTVPKCRWDIDILEEWIWRLSQYYGNCMIVPEINMDRGLTKGLKDRGANLYERMSDEERGDIMMPKSSGKLGFNTRAGYKEGTRTAIIENLARYIREWNGDKPGLEADPHTINELNHFVIDPKTGREEAADKHHDDSVLALAIGMECEARGTVFYKRVDLSTIPKDLRDDYQELNPRRRRGRYH